jgi:hypothetical protein
VVRAFPKLAPERPHLPLILGAYLYFRRRNAQCQQRAPRSSQTTTEVIMFARLYHVLHDSMLHARNRQRDDYLAASSDLAELEHRMRRLETDPFDSWPASEGFQHGHRRDH